MNPLLLIKGAIEITTSIKAFKENLKRPSTPGALLPAAAALAAPEVLPPDSLEAAVTQIALGLVALVMFFWNDHK